MTQFSESFEKILKNIRIPAVSATSDILPDPVTGKLRLFNKEETLGLDRNQLTESKEVASCHRLYTLDKEHAIEALPQLLSIFDLKEIKISDPRDYREIEKVRNQNTFYSDVASAVLVSYLSRFGNEIVEKLEEELKTSYAEKNFARLNGIVESLKEAKVFKPEIIDFMVTLFIDSFSLDCRKTEQPVSETRQVSSYYLKSAGDAVAPYFPVLLESANFSDSGYEENLGLTYDSNWECLHNLLSANARRAPDSISGALTSSLDSPFSKERAMALSLLAEIPAQALVNIEKISDAITDEVLLNQSEALNALKILGPKAALYGAKVLGLAGTDKLAAEFALETIGFIAEPREEVVSFLINLWEELAPLEEDTEYVADKGNSPTSIEEKLQGALAELALEMRPDYAKDSVDPRVMLKPLITALCAMSDRDDRIKTIFSKACESKSALILHSAQNCINLVKFTKDRQL